MRNLDLNSLTSLYENKVIARNLVSEAMPPYGAGEVGSGESSKLPYSPEGKSAEGPAGAGQRAAMSSQYPAYPRLNREQMQRAAPIVAKKIVEFLGTLPNKTFTQGTTNKEEDAEFRRLVGQMIVKELKQKSGDPVFPQSHAVHVARQLADALISAKILTYTPLESGKGKSGPKVPKTPSSSELDF